MAGVMINGKKGQVLYKDNKELKRSLRLLKAYYTPSDPFHEEASEEIAVVGTPLIESSSD